MKFQMEDDIVEGRGYADIVAAMSSFKLEDVRSIKRYRRATAKRVKAMFGTDIDHSTDESFVKDLVKAGLLKKV